MRWHWSRGTGREARGQRLGRAAAANAGGRRRLKHNMDGLAHIASHSAIMPMLGVGRINIMRGGPYPPKWEKMPISVFYTVETGCSRRFDRCKARCVWTSVCVWTRSVFSPGQLLEGQYSVWSVTHEKVRLEEGYAFTTGCRRGTILPQH